MFRCINEEMTLKDRTNLLIQLIRNLDADDLTDYYNLINLIFDGKSTSGFSSTGSSSVIGSSYGPANLKDLFI